VNRSPLTAILLIVFVDLAAFGLIIPLQAVYAERLGASGFVFGCLVGVYSLMQFLCSPLLGRLSDRVGRRPVLLLSVLGNALSYVVMGMADLAASLPLLFVSRTLCGVTAANIATAQSYIADVTTPADRARGMGLFGAAFGLGFILGPAMAAGLNWVGQAVSGPEYGTAWPAFGAAVLSAAAFVLALTLLPESRTRRPAQGGHPLFDLAALSRIARAPGVGQPILLLLLTTFAFVFLEVTYVYLCRDRFGFGMGGVGLIFAYVGVIMVVVQGGSIGPLVRRFGEPPLVVAGALLTALGLLMTSGVMAVPAYGPALALLLVACIPFAFGQGISKPALDGLISRNASADRQGVTLGLANGLTSIVRAVAPPIGGWLYDVRPEMPYWSGTVLLLAGAVIAWHTVAGAGRTPAREPRAGGSAPGEAGDGSETQHQQHTPAEHQGGDTHPPAGRLAEGDHSQDDAQHP